VSDDDAFVEDLGVQPAARPERRAVGWWRQRYEGSVAQDLVNGVGDVEFGSWIIVFGASFLLSVLR
jgi:hypothetical protein